MSQGNHYNCASQQQAASVYKSVINDVVSNVKEAFLDEGVDESVLNELRAAWEERIKNTRAADLDGSLAQELKKKPQANLASAHLIRGPETSRGASSAQNAMPQRPMAHHTHVIQHTVPQGYIIQPHSQLRLPTVPAGAERVMLNPQQLAMLMASKGKGGGQVHQLDGHAYISPLPTSENKIYQIDGGGGVSDDDEDEDEDDNIDTAQIVDEGEPLNSDDDADSDEEGEAMFDADHVVICQYEKVSRVRTKWKIILKDGIMNIDGKDYAFQKATGEAEW